MNAKMKPENVFSLSQVLPVAERGAFAIGSFSPRSTVMIAPVLAAGQSARSPLIVQIAEPEFSRGGVSPEDFAAEFYQQLRSQKITVPVVLHLDHTRQFDLIRRAISAGFTSVMIDASDHDLEENIAITRRVVDFAHPAGVSVEAELGRIGSTDQVETGQDEEVFTRPAEAQRFVAETRVDALAVSVGTAHGVYLVRQPRIDNQRLREIRALTRVALVIHGGSGIPADMLKQAYVLPGGGPSKVNIATDLELAYVQALGRTTFLSDAGLRSLPPEQKQIARAAVEACVREKIEVYLGSAGRAADFAGL